MNVWALAQVKRCSANLSPSSSWIYLGKDLDNREAVARILGEKELLSLNDRLHRVAERLRQPFLNFIADLGRMQSDQLGWWSSSCSWKDGGRSDLFLLICYEHLIDELRRESKDRRRPLLVIVEDPWLFYQLKELYAGLPDVQFYGNPWLWPACLKAVVWGIGARLIWSLRLVRNYVVQRWFWKWSKKYGQPVSPSIAFYSDLQTRCFQGKDGWRDPYLGELDSILEKAGYSILRFSPPESGGFERALAQRSRYFAPLILWLSPPSLFRSAFASWRPVWPLDPEIGGLPIQWLLLREGWLDGWRSSYLIFRVFFDCLGKLLERFHLQLIIYPYENQPWEKMLVLAARSHGVPTLGYQHGGGLSRFNLAYFHGPDEATWAPLADLIVASGPYAYELMAMGGTPRERLVMGGNLRHQYLRNFRDRFPLPNSGVHVRVLVALPNDQDLGQHLLYALWKAFPDGGLNEGIEFLIKPHPMCPLTGKMLKFPATFLSGTFADALSLSTVVLYSGTGTGMEAVVMGRIVLRYRSELLLNTDRGELIHDESVIECGDHDLKDKLLFVVRTQLPSPSRQYTEKLLTQIFIPPDHTAWLHAVTQLCARR